MCKVNYLMKWFILESLHDLQSTALCDCIPKQGHFHIIPKHKQDGISTDTISTNNMHAVYRSHSSWRIQIFGLGKITTCWLHCMNLEPGHSPMRGPLSLDPWHGEKGAHYTPSQRSAWARSTGQDPAQVIAQRWTFAREEQAFVFVTTVGKASWGMWL